MKNVLMITYYFPPVGGIPVMRVSKFVKYLPHNGWKPFILTVKECDFYYHDEGMAKMVPDDAVVFRTSWLNPVGLYKKFTRFKTEPEEPNKGAELPEIEIKDKGLKRFLKVIASNLFIPDGYIGWLPFAVIKGLKIIRDEKIDIIYSTAPPWTSHLVGLCLKKLTGKPWVADFRDLWTEGEVKTKSTFSKRIEEALEKKTLESADSIITVVESCKDKIIEKFPVCSPGKFVNIYNGFDPDDFHGIRPKSFLKFTIVHTGTLWPQGILKGLLTALLNIPRDIRNNIELILLGGAYRMDRELVRDFNLKGLVRLKPFVSYSECLSYQLGSTALLLIRPAIESETALSSKIFEYLAAKKPILAIAPPTGAAGRLVRKTKTGIVVHPEDTPGIKTAILDLYNRHKKGTLDLEEQPAGRFKQFERKELTVKLANVFNELSA